MLQERILKVKSEIADAAKRAGKSADDITLIAVSKTIDIETVKEAYFLGLNTFGENKPQEIRDKRPEIPDAKWHMIGRLQSNKIKYVTGTTELIHSVDSVELLEQINTYAQKQNAVQKILIQLNLSQEISKGGIDENDLGTILEAAEKCDNIKVKGLMTIGSAFASEYELKKLFEKCYNIFVDNQTKSYHNIDMTYLSMGMSGDFKTAIEMGSNMVRIGTGIFGARKYTK